jgi:hypothetical protein
MAGKVQLGAGTGGLTLTTELPVAAFSADERKSKVVNNQGTKFM